MKIRIYLLLVATIRRWLLLVAVALLSGGVTARAQSPAVSVVEWDFNSNTTYLNATVVNPAVVTNPVAFQGNGNATIGTISIARSSSPVSPFYITAGGTWPGAEDTAFTGVRSGLVPRAAKSISTNFTLSPLAAGDLSALQFSFSYLRTTTSPSKVRAVLTWMEGTTTKRRYTSSVTLTPTVWTNSSATFSTGDALPSNVASLPCLLEIYFWNNATSPNSISLDNVKILCNSLANSYSMAPAALIDWPVNREYNAQFSIPSYAGSVTWGSSGSLPAGLALNTSTGQLSGTPTATGTSTFTITASGTGLSASKSYTLNVVAAPAAPPSGTSVVKITFDSDTDAQVPAPLPATDVASSIAEVSYGYDASGTLNSNLYSGGLNALSTTPINPAKAGKMRTLHGWNSSNTYTNTRDSLLHYTGASAAAQARFNVYPSANTANIPLTSKTTTGVGAVWQTRITTDTNTAGDLLAFYFDALRWKKDDMAASGINGPRWAALRAYWTDDAGALQRWDSSNVDISAVYLPEYRGTNQFGRFWFDLNSGATGLNQLIKSTVTKHRSRTVFFDLYVWHDTGADLSGINGTNPPALLLDEAGIIANFTNTVPQMSIGNTVFIDTNYNNHFDAGEGISGISVQLTNTSGTVLQSTTTGTGGTYRFTGLAEGNYVVKIPASELPLLSSGKPLYQMTSVPGNGTDNRTDDNTDENGIDNSLSWLFGISSPTINLYADNEPVNGGTETGNNATADDADDDNGDMTVDFGFQSRPTFSLGNRVYKDSNGNNQYDPGEGVDGVAVQLLNSSGTQINTQTTANGGRYLFTPLAANQSYYVRVASTNFAAAGALNGLLSVVGNGSDDNVDHDDNGVDDAAAATNGIKSPLITPNATHGSLFNYTYPPSATAVATNNAGGTWTQVSLQNDYVNKLVKVSVTLDTATQNTQALWMVLTNGTDPTVTNSNMAAIYLANGTVTVTPYGASGSTTHTLGTSIYTTTYTTTNIGTKRTFKFTLDAAAINSWAARPATWAGIGFPYDALGGLADPASKKIGVRIRSFADGAATLAGSAWTVTFGSAGDPNVGLFDDVVAISEIGGDQSVDFGFVQPLDYGDYSALGSASSAVVSTLYMGTTVDGEVSPSLNATATGDDLNGTDDEDGVTLPTTLVPGATATITVNVTNNSGAVAYLNGWIDYTGNDSLGDSGEQIATNTIINNGTTNANQTINITVPASAVTGIAGVRFRLTSTTSPGSTGLSGNGEVEDYTVIIGSAAGSGASPLVDYNVIVRSNASTTSDVEGKMMAKSFTGASSVTLAKNLTGTSSGTQVVQFQNGAVSGGSLNLQYGSLFAPSAGSLNGRTINYNGGGSLQTTPVPDFATVFNGIQSASTAYSSLTANGTVTIPGSPAPVTLQVGTLDANGVAIFSVDGNQLLNNPNVQSIDINLNGRNPTAILINVIGNTVTYSSSGNFVGNMQSLVTRPKLLWNFYQASSVIYQKSMFGSTLAPNATLETYGGAVEGSVAVNNLTSTIEVHLPVFTGGIITGATATADFGDYSGFIDASSTVVSNLRMGAAPDAESAPSSNATATGDDTTGSDDEDGVTVPASMTQGAAGSLVVTVTNTTGSAAYLNAWIDFNRNGVLTDAGEQIANNQNVANNTNGSNVTINFTVPAGASVGAAGVRVRLTSTTGPGSTGFSGNGEVEDYVTNIASSVQSDFGDYSVFASASSTVNNAIRLGAVADGEASATANTGATGDDNTGSDDEDGVSVPATLVQGVADSLAANVTNTSGAVAYLNAWIDFNGNGVLTDAGEQIATNVPIANGTNNSPQTLNFTTPAGAVVGTAGVRVRLTSSSTPGSTGASGSGEVEDYITTIATPTPTLDFGDYANFGSASSTVVSSIKLGATTDAETTATINSGATGDDGADADDEDGAIVPLNLQQGGSSTIAAIVTNTSGAAVFLNAWVDFNNNGVLTDAGEQIATNVSIANNSNALSQPIIFTTPANAALGTVGVRIRLTSTSSPGATGASGNGEVEDYVTTIACGTSTVWGIDQDDNQLFSFQSPRNIADVNNLVDYGPVYYSPDGSMNPATAVSLATLANGFESFAIDANGVAYMTTYADVGTVLGPVLMKLDLKLANRATTGLKNIATILGSVSSISPGIQGLAFQPSTGQLFGSHKSNTGTRLYKLGTAGSPSTAATLVGTMTGALGTSLTCEDIEFTPDGRLLAFDLGVETTEGDETLFEINPTTGAIIGIADANPGGGITNRPANNLLKIEGIAWDSTRSVLTFNDDHNNMWGNFDNLTTAGSNVEGAVSDTIVTDCEGYRYMPCLAPATLDFGDWNGSGALTASTSSAVNQNLKLGALVEAEYGVTPNAISTSDDISGIDDEDGVTVPSSITQGASATIPVTVFNNTGASAYLNAWIDFNNDGSFNDTLVSSGGERLEATRVITSSAAATTQNITFTVPAVASIGAQRGVRIRLTNQAATLPTGLVGQGEVEDYVVTIAPVGTISVGNLVWNDSIQNGVKDAAESGIDGVTVELWRAGALVGSTVTAGGGLYSFNVAPNTGFSLKIPTPPAAYPFGGYANDYTDNGVDNNGSGYQPGGKGTAVWTGAFDLTANGEPGTTGTTNSENTWDFAFRAVPNPASLLEYTMEAGGPPELPSAKNSSITIASQLQIAAGLTSASVAGTTAPLRAGVKDVDIGGQAGAYAPSLESARSSLTPTDRTINTTFTFAPGSTGTIGNGYLDVCPSGTPDNVRFFLTWFDGSVYRTAWTNTVVASPDFWTTVDAPFVNGAALPAGSALGGKTFLLEVFVWGSNPSVDNIILGGTCTLPAVDYGDWSGSGAQTTATYSTVDSNLRLGATIDGEPTVTPNAAASADGADEDGVTIPANASRGAHIPFTYVVTNTTPVAASINAWVDWNNNGTFDAAEQIIANDPVPVGTSAQSRTVPVTVPATAVTTQALGVRFRLSDASGTVSPTGLSGKGEVEDYTITVGINTKDFGDAPASYGSVDHTVSAGLCLGSLEDAEASAQSGATATGDDTNGADDEDGVFFDSAFIQGGVARGVVGAHGTGYLNMWVDWNRDGDFADAGEQVVINNYMQADADGNASPAILKIPVPANAVLGATYVRARFSSASGLAATGSAIDGEVEDYTVSTVAGATISGRVWKDNNNGIQNVGELGLENFAVILYRANGKAEAIAITDAAGAYQFSALAAGSYYVAVDLPNAHTLSALDLGGNDTLDNDFSPGTGQTAPIVVVAGGSSANTDAGVNVPANTVSYAVINPLATTAWSKNFTLPKLSPATGTPTAVQVRCFVQEVQDFLYEHSGSGLDSYNLDLSNSFTVVLPDSSTLDTAGVYSNTANLATFDNCVDYHGASGIVNYDVTRVMRRASTNFASPAMFAGAGTVGLNGSGNYSFNQTGGGNSRYSLATQAAAIVAVTYTYTPVGNDFGDWNGAGAQTASTRSVVNPNLRLGATVDSEVSVTPDTTASADGTDEDGVTMPVSIAQGASVIIPVSVYNNTGANAYLNAWIDFNNDGTFDDLPVSSGGERLETVRTIVSNATATTQNINFAVPAAASVGGQRGVRFRLTDQAATLPTGALGSGEVEDYVVAITASGLSLGNLVFADNNANGKFDVGDSGVGGVSVQLWSPGPDTIPLNADDVQVGAALNTSLTGVYMFTGLGAGTYYVKIPASQFASGKPLFGKESSSGWSIDAQDDNINENGIDSPRPEVTGIVSPLISLGSGTGPAEAGQNGADDDISPGDANGDLTIDFGFIPRCNSTRMLIGEYAPVNKIIEYPFSGAGPGASCGSINGIGGEGMVVDEVTGKMYFATAGSGVQVYDIETGTYQPFWGTGYYQTLAFSPDRKFLYAVEGWRIVRIPLDGTVPGVADKTYEIVNAQPLSPNAGFWGCAVNPMTGDIYVTRGFGAPASYGPGRVYRMTPDLSTATVMPGTISAVQGYYTGIAMMPDGTFWVANVSINPGSGGAVKDSLIHFTNNGTLIANVPINLSPTGPTDTYAPYGLALGPDGKLYVALQNYGSLPSGGPTIFCIAQFDPASNVFVDYLRGPTGTASKGIGFTCANVTCVSDFGDWSGAGALTTSTSSSVNTSLRLGATIDTESYVVPNAAATADGADEDGVTMPLSVTQGASVTIPVSVFNNTGSAAYLNAWIDFNNDGTFNDTLVSAGGERLEAARSIASGASATTQNITFTVPVKASFGTLRGVRFRLTNQAATPPVGIVGTGEIEDYTVSIASAGGAFTCNNDKYLVQNDEVPAGSGNWTAHFYLVDVGPSLSELGSYPGKRLNGLSYSNGYYYAVDLAGNHLYKIDSGGGLADLGAVTGLPVPGASQQWSGATVLGDGKMLLNLGTFSPAVQTDLYLVNIATVAVSGTPVTCIDDASGVALATNFGDIVWDSLANRVYGMATTDLTVAGLTEIDPVTGRCKRIAPSTLLAFGSLACDSLGNVYGYGASAGSGAQDTLYQFGRTDGLLNGSLNPVGVGPSVTSSDGAACPGSMPLMSIGNQVWYDDNQNGIKDAIEGGISGVTLKLFRDGQNAATDIPVATTTSDASGLYVFSGLNPGRYFVDIANPPAAYPAISSAPVILDNSVDNDNNGIQFGSGARVSSPVITLSGKSESTTDGDASANTDLTVDFGFYAPPTLDYGDYQGFASASSSVLSTLKLGALYDAEASAVTNMTATGDDTSGVADEDGVTVPATITQGLGASLAVVATNDTNSVAYLNAWIDFNNNGVLTDPGEQIATNVPVAKQTIAGSFALNFTVPSGATVGTVGVRVRLTTTSSPGSVGNSGSGEVEDYVTSIVTANDFGDYSGFANASSVLSQALLMGASIDGELSATTSATAAGDDGAGIDDEDGATVPASVNTGASVTIPVRVTNTSGAPAYLNAWFDFNRNGVLTDAGEQIAVNVLVPNSVSNALQNVTFSVPAGATTGVAGIRFRLTSVINPGPVGSAGIGEVEDYVATINPGITLGNLVWADTNNNGIKDTSETGISGAVVELLNGAGSVLLGSTTTDSAGAYSFVGLTAGTYKVRVAPVTAYPLASTSVGTDNGTDGNNDGTQTGGAGSPSTSFIVTLALNGEPGSAGAGNTEGTIDFGFRACPTITITPVALANGAAGTAYSAVVSAAGGTSPYTYSLSSGTLPGGLSLGAATGVISGTPLSSGSSSFTVKAVDSKGCAGTAVVALTITGPSSQDYGDFSLFPSANSTVSAAVRLGATVDAELTPISNSLATGDDINGGDDEDGVWFPVMRIGYKPTIAVQVYNTSGAAAYLNGWIDFNNNGSADAGEQIIVNQSIASGTRGNDEMLHFTLPAIPATAVTGAPLGVRFRLTTTSNPGFAGASGSGEVEDYTVTVLPSVANTLLNPSFEAANLAEGTEITPVSDWTGAGASAGTYPLRGVFADGYQCGWVTAPVGSSDIVYQEVNVPVGGYSFVLTYNEAMHQPTLNVGEVRLEYLDALGNSISGSPMVSNRMTWTMESQWPAATFSPLRTLTLPVAPLLAAKVRVSIYFQHNDAAWDAAKTDVMSLVALSPPLSIGNLVWNDCNNDGIKQATEPGLSGALAKLFSPGTDGLPNTADDVQVGASQITNAAGAYLFDNLQPGTYFVKVTPPDTYWSSGGLPVVLPDIVDDDNNGAQPGGTGTVVSSPLVVLAPGTGPTTEDANANTNLTIDFGFWPGFEVGNLVWNDANNNGVKNALESGVEGVTVSLMMPGASNNVTANDATIVQTTTTDANGLYSLRTRTPGNYFVRILPLTGYELASASVINADNGVDNDNNGTQSGKSKSAINSAIFTLGICSEPGTAGTTNYENTIDFGLVGCPTIVVTPNSLPYSTANEAFTAQLVASGGTGPYTWAVVSGTLPASINLNATTGLIDGVSPSEPINIPITIEATDANGCKGQSSGIACVVYAEKIGNKVWYDANCNGLCDPSEPGIGGVSLKLYKRGPDGVAYNADDVLVASTTSAADGSYSFANLVPEVYWVKVTPPPAYPLATSNVVFQDNSTDNDNNGAQPAGGGTAVRSPLITLTPNAETTAEDGDNNSDMTVDFGLRPGFTVGDLVFKDDNDNGLFDVGETGMAGATVTLMSPGADNVVGGTDDSVIMSTTTNASGNYSFSIPVAGKYFVRVQPVSGYDASSDPVSTSDNGVNNDNNGSQPGGATTYVYSPVFTLQPCTEPGTAGTGNDELTIDFGMVPSNLGIGNLVFDDMNGNGRYDGGEGLDGITVELYLSSQTPGVSTPAATTVTANGGRYIFEHLTRASYVVHLPAAQFGATGRLRAMYSVPGVQSDNSDDNLGEDSIDAASPATTGITSRVVSLNFNAAPTDASQESGFDNTSDNTPAGKDDDYDLTIDMGLYRRVGVGNLVFFDTNGNGHADSGEGVNGVTVQLYKGTQTPGTDSPLMTTTTTGGGQYLFSDLQPGLYIVHIPASMFATGAPLAGRMSISQGAFGDDDVGEDGLNDTDPPTQGVSGNPVFLQASTCPTAQNGETGINSSSDDAIDAAVDLTVDFGFQNPVAVGNLVFFDANNNGHYDSGEGVNGVTVELYRTGSVPGFSIPLASMVTSAGGHYLFNMLPGGDYFVHVPATNFAAGGALFEKVSMTGVAAILSDDNAGENGQDSAAPAVTGISSADFTLTAGSMPTNTSGESGFRNTDDDANSQDLNGDMTIDFGFVPPDPNRVGVGNAVFNDLNGNGHMDETEGVDGVLVELYGATSNNLVSMATTANGGNYLFGNLAPGTYYVKLPPANWNNVQGVIGKLIGMRPMPGQGGDNHTDDDLDENGDDPARPDLTGVRSTNFTLAAGVEPTDFDSETGSNTFVDFGVDENYDLTIDFGFYKPVGVGNLVFVDANANGRADSGEGVGGITVKLFKAGDDPAVAVPVATQTTSTNSLSKGKYFFGELSPGYYFVHIPAAMFQSGGPLFGKMSMTGVESTVGDDNLGEDGVDPGDLTTAGISTDVFLLSPGSLPFGTAEAGLFGGDDDGSSSADDKNADLTRDFGFTSSVCVGNLVFLDLNRDGKYTSGTDQGINGVTVELWQQLTNGGSQLAATTTTANGGLYNFCVPAGTYSVRIPATMFGLGAVLANTQATSLGVFSVTTGSGNTAVTTAQDDNVAQDAADGGNALVNGAYTGWFVLSAGAMPTDATGETGVGKTSDNGVDADSNLTIDLGFKPLPLTVGNLVFMDNNSNGKYDAGDAGVAGVEVKLFAYGTDPLTGTPVASGTTSANGIYSLTAYSEGQYFVHIAKTNFNAAVTTTTGNTTTIVTPAGPLFGLLSSVGSATGTGDDNLNENGLDSLTPITTGISSNVLSLLYGSMPVDASSETGVQASLDNASDANGDMTVDFGFRIPATQSAALAGRVVRDLTESGVLAANAPALQGVEVSLYSGDTALQTTTTDASGNYVFADVAPGTYVIAATPLPGAVSTVDTDGGAPDKTNVTLTTEPKTSLDFAQSLAPDTFVQWQSQHAGAGGVDANPDGDGASNLLEYALGTDPDSGVQGAAKFHLEADGNSISAVLARPGQGHLDVQYVLEGSSDLEHWSALQTPSASTFTGDVETLRFAKVNDDALFAGGTSGAVRLKVTLDADHNGSVEANAVSQTFGFSVQSLGVGQQTLSMPLLRDEIYTGIITTVHSVGLAVDGAAGLKAAMKPGVEYVAEILDGPSAGNRFDVNETITADGLVALDLASNHNTLKVIPADALGAHVSVRPHWTLGSLLPASRFHAATSATIADRVLFFDKNAWQPHWLCQTKTDKRWITSATLADTAARVINDGEGFMVQPRAGTVTLPLVGIVRARPAVGTIAAGTQLLGSQSVRAVQTLPGLNVGDSLRIWSGDTEPGTASYTTFSASAGGWVDDQGRLVPAGTNLIAPFRAVFVVRP